MDTERIISDTEVKEFNNFYSRVLDEVIRHAKYLRKINHECCDECLDFIDEDIFTAVWRTSSRFPDFENYENQSYQSTAFIGYLRGYEDCLDSISRLIGHSLNPRGEEDDQ